MTLDPRRISSSSQADAARARAFAERIARLERGSTVSSVGPHAGTHHHQDGADPLSAGMIGAYTTSQVDALIAAIPGGGSGSQLLSGSGAPSSGLGSNGDVYIDSVAYDLYGPKAAAAWGTGISLVGPAGATTIVGVDGLQAALDSKVDLGAGSSILVDGTITSELNIRARNGDGNQVEIGSRDDGQAAIQFGSAADTELYRSAAGELRTDGKLHLGDGTAVAYTSGLLAARPSAAAGEGTLYYATDDATLTFSDGSSWVSTQGPQGDTGDTGADSTVPGPAGADSTVPGPTGPAGADSTVPGPAGADSTVPGPTGPAGADSIVPGPTGPAGSAATVTVGTTSTGTAAVTNSGTSSAAVFDFTLPQGAPGADGKTVLSGSGAPSSGLGVDNDFYIDTATTAIYGPKTSGVWGSSTSLIGPAGSGGGGGGGAASRSTLTQAVTVAAGAEVSIDLTLAKSFTLYQVTATKPCRVRMYQSSSARTSDQSRLSTAAPTAQGLVAEMIFDPALVTSGLFLNPPQIGFNVDATSTTCCLVRNDDASANLSLTFTYLPIEA